MCSYLLARCGGCLNTCPRSRRKPRFRRQWPPGRRGGVQVRKTGLWFLLALVIGVFAFAAAGCGGDDDGDGGGVTALPAASCGQMRYEGEGDPDFLIASDLPLQGANRSLTTEMADAIEFVLKKREYKAGDYTIGYQSCDDSTAQAGSWDSAKCSSNARAYANNKSVLGVVGTFNS